MVNRRKLLQNLFKIWEQSNFNIEFYFERIFKLSVEQLKENTNELVKNRITNSQYKSIFVPFGFTIENIALFIAIMKPELVTFGFSNISKIYHFNNHFDLFINEIKKVNPLLKYEIINISSDEQNNVESKIFKWKDEMLNQYKYEIENLAIDLTGGTKIMSLGAVSSAIKIQSMDAFYLFSEYDPNNARPIPGTEQLIKYSPYGINFDRNFVFVIMPFDPNFDTIYTWIRNITESMNLKCVRVDEEIFQGGIMDKVEENILKSAIIIADLTNKNPNVFYELGLANAQKKKVIMLTQDTNDIPFDLRHKRCVKYDVTHKDQFIEKLTQEINFLMKE